MIRITTPNQMQARWVRRRTMVAGSHWLTLAAAALLLLLARFLPPVLYDRIMTRVAARINLPY